LRSSFEVDYHSFKLTEKVRPGALDTLMLHRAISFWGMKPEEAAAPYPIKRLATTEEMARSVM
jgi:hypothetical protein